MNVPTANIAADAPVLLREREKDLAILVLNRPDVRNSLSEAMLIALSSPWVTSQPTTLFERLCLLPMDRRSALDMTSRNSPADAAMWMAAERISNTSWRRAAT